MIWLQYHKHPADGTRFSFADVWEQLEETEVSNVAICEFRSRRLTGRKCGSLV